MKKVLMVILAAAFGIGLVPGDLSWVYAQEVEEFTLEEITVTAQKREENLQKVAVPIETISGYEVTEMGRTNLEEALTNIAAATVQRKGREYTVTIRAMDDDNQPGDSFSMVAVVVDGTYSNSWGIGQSGLYDMQRIEVLTGPQGTLYSRNAAGGVVHMISNNPTTEKFEGSGSLEFGNYHTVNTSGMVNVPINDKIAVRGAFQTLMHDGYHSNGTNDADFKSTRVKLGYDDPSEDMTAILGFDYNSQRGHGQGLGVDPWETPPENPWYSFSCPDLYHTDRDTSKAYMDFKLGTPIGDLTFLPAIIYMRGRDRVGNRVMGQVNVLQYGGPIDDQNEYSGELRLNSLKDSFMTWIVGLYYYKRIWTTSGVRVYPEENIIEGGNNFRQHYNVNKSVFGNITYPISDTFRVTVGGRYTKDNEIFSEYNPEPMFPGQPIWQQGHYPSSHFDYKLAVEYDLSEDTMLWADHSTGYKHIIRSQQCQELDSYQLGSKSRFFNQRLQVNATAWYYDYVNFNVSKSKSFIALDGDTEQDPGTGLGDATLYGLDLVTNYLITPNDRIDFSASYLHSEISDVLITYTYYYPPEYVESGGTSLNNAPEWSMVMSYQHVFNLSNGGSLTAKATTRYETEKTVAFQPSDWQFPGFNLERLNYEPSHHISEASLNYSAPSGKWSLNGYIKNIENHPEKIGLAQSDLRVGEPRTYGVVVSVRF